MLSIRHHGSQTGFQTLGLPMEQASSQCHLSNCIRLPWSFHGGLRMMPHGWRHFVTCIVHHWSEWEDSKNPIINSVTLTQGRQGKSSVQLRHRLWDRTPVSSFAGGDRKGLLSTLTTLTHCGNNEHKRLPTLSRAWSRAPFCAEYITAKLSKSQYCELRH